MNRILLAVNAILLVAVIILFIKVFSPVTADAPVEAKKEDAVKAPPPAPMPGNAPTGRIAFVNIDRLNEESLEIEDLVAESKRRKNSIEASVESLSMQYQKKVEEFQNSQKAGIAPESELRAKAKEIEAIEKEAQNKQVQMDNLSMDINEKNMNFQKNVKDFLVKWNNGRYDYILSYSESVPSMLLGNGQLEITSEVITGLNSEYKARKGAK